MEQKEPFDARLRDLVHGQPTPPVPELEARVLRLVRRRRTIQRWAVGLAAAAVIGVASLALVDLKPGARKPVEVVRATLPTSPTPAAPTAVMKDVDVAFRESPVLRLDSDRQQAIVLSLFMLMTTQTKSELTPLTEEQGIRLKTLLKETQERAAAIKAQLDNRERELAQVYFEYDLNERRASALQAEIVELQKEKFANYHKLQVEIRTIVGKERFDVLKQRLRYAGFFGPDGGPKELDRPRPKNP